MSSQTLADDCSELINSCRSLMLATTGGDSAHCSYVPFVWMNEKAFILVSDLAEHTGNLKSSGDFKIGCMLIEDESACAQIFARRRLMFKSAVNQISRDAEKWPVLIAQFKLRFGEIIDLLEALPDFVIFELKPEQAVLVKGFGDAHKLDPETFNLIS